MAAAPATMDRTVLRADRADRLGRQDSKPAVHGGAGAADLRGRRPDLGPPRRVNGGADYPDQLSVLPAGDLHHQRPGVHSLLVWGDLFALPRDKNRELRTENQ